MKQRVKCIFLLGFISGLMFCGSMLTYQQSKIGQCLTAGIIGTIAFMSGILLVETKTYTNFKKGKSDENRRTKTKS